MTEQDKNHEETIEEFRKSLNYGSRNDLLFKFLGGNNLGSDDTADFLQELLTRLGDAYDTGEFDGVVQHMYESQVRGYTPKPQPPGAPTGFEYDDSPWTPLAKPLSESRLVMISTGGLFVDGDDPMGPDGPTQEEAIPRIGEFLRGPAMLATIPLNTPPNMMRVRHPGYDIRGTQRDYNVVFPVDRLKELHQEGVIGELAGDNYSFVGATSQKRLLAESAPAWAEMLKEHAVDVALLVGA